MSYKDLVLLCKKIKDIYIPRVNGNYLMGDVPYNGTNYDSVRATIKDNNVVKISISWWGSGYYSFMIFFIEKDHIRIDHNNKITIIEYDILDEEHDVMYYTLKYGRYDDTIPYCDLLAIYYYLESNYNSKS